MGRVARKIEVGLDRGEDRDLMRDTCTWNKNFTVTSK